MEMMSGEFKSMTEIHNAVPAFAPIPIAWGTYASDPDIHFFLCSFHEMSEELPNVQRFSAQVAELHRKGKSPTGKYGFPCTTFQGNLPQDNTWTDTWEEFYVNGMKRMLQLEEESQGPSQELTDLCVAMYEKVIPRLLRPLETGGRQIEPCLVHGDLWYGNASTDDKTDEPLVFDACCFYAHNEYELGTWRPTRYKLGRPYVKAYHKNFPVSAPVEDHDDRNALYSIRFNLHASALYSGNTRFRTM
jgi:protein-ribulosamine 3-kinase